MSLSTGTFIASVTILWPYTFLYTLKLIYNYGKFSRDLQTQYKIEIGKKSEKKNCQQICLFCLKLQETNRHFLQIQILHCICCRAREDSLEFLPTQIIINIETNI